jgi:hypothetical protein
MCWTDLFIARGTPAHVRSDNGPELVARAMQGWIQSVGAKTAFIEPGSPWENGNVESFNGKLRDELLNGGVFNSLAEARVLIGSKHCFGRAGARQHRSPPFLAWLQSTSPGGDHARRNQANAPSRFQWLIGPATAHDPLKSCLGQSVGAGQ